MTEQSLYSTAQPAALVELLQQHTTQHPEQTASSFWVEGDVGEIRWTYRNLDERARMIGAHLQAPKAAGERVLLLFPLCLDYSDFILLLVMHHIVTHFWSLAILAEELSVLYLAECRHRAIHRSPQLQTAYVAPRTELEWRIAQVR